MIFNIRKNDKYLDVSVTIDNITINLGLLDETERINLANDLLDTVHQLVTDIPYKKI
jgi:hypothetical protein